MEEALPYPALGEGAHLFVQIEKVDLATWDAVRHVLAAWGRADRRSSAGAAGMKDKAAVATQWFSIEWPESEVLPDPGPIALPEGLEGASLQVLQVRRHPHKLRTGHVAHNRFRIRIRDAAHPERAQPVAEALRRVGLPNRYGPQRFGRDGDNAQMARAILAGDRRAPRDRGRLRLLMSALQSDLFNRVLDDRLVDGSWRQALEGDLMMRHGRGALFPCLDPVAEQPRVDALEISPSGPVFGKKMRWPTIAAEARERQVLQASGLTPGQVARLGPGTRRPLRVPVPDLVVEPEADGYVVQVTLPAGTYATVVLDELVKPEGERFRRSALRQPAGPPPLPHDASDQWG